MIPLGALLCAATPFVPACIACPRQATEGSWPAARQLLSPEAQAVGFQAGGYLNFEEDCDAPVVLRELMDSGIIAPRTDNYFRPGEYEACIDRSLQHWNPAYWQARQERLSVREAKAAKERER